MSVTHRPDKTRSSAEELKAFRASIIKEVKAEIVAQNTETEKTIIEGIRENLVSPPQDGEEWSERKSYIEGDVVTFKGKSLTATHYSRGKSPAEYPDFWKVKPTEEAVKAWADIPDGTVIAEGEKVTQDGKTWICKSQHIKSTVYKPKAGSSKWEEVVVGVRA
mgnify:CR=1 FL=1